MVENGISGSKKEITFSIITVVYNGGNYFRECLQSIRHQTFRNFEYIVIDGGSTDGTIELAKEYAEVIDIFVSEVDKGIYDAMNKGISAASGRYIGIINSDDYYLADTLQRVFEIIENSNSENIIYGGVMIADQPNSFEFIEHTRLENVMIFHPAVFVPAKVYQEVGTFNLKYQVAADYDFLLNCYSRKYPFIGCKKPFAVYRIGGFSNSHRFRSMWETLKIQLKYTSYMNIFAMTNFIQILLKTIVKNLLSQIYSFRGKNEL